MGHFVLSPREWQKRDRRDSRGDEREGQERKRSRRRSHTVGCPSDLRYTTPSPHSGSVVQRPLCDREVAGSIPGLLKWPSAIRK